MGTHTHTHTLPCIVSTIWQALNIWKGGDSVCDLLKETDLVWGAIKLGFKSSQLHDLLAVLPWSGFLTFGISVFFLRMN